MIRALRRETGMTVPGNGIRPALYLLVLLNLLAPTAYAEDIDMYYIGKVTASEYNLLPSYCKRLATDKNPELAGSQALSTDEQIITKGIGGLHHYCNIFILRGRYYKERVAGNKEFLLSEILGETDYVISHSELNAPLLYRAHLEKGRALADKKQEAKSIVEYMSAMRLNPTDAAAYLDMARIYVKLNDKAKAMDVILNGLAHIPNSKSLQRRYKELGGELPYEKPHPTNSAEATPDEIQMDRPKAGKQTVGKAENTNSRATDIVENKIKSEASKPASDILRTEKITNPYCRFCPNP